MTATTDLSAAGPGHGLAGGLTATLYGFANLVGGFVLACVLWYVFLHPNGEFALYTPMYGFSLLVALVASIVFIAKVLDFWPLDDGALGRVPRGVLLSVAAFVLMLVLVYGFFWNFIGRFGITYFSPQAIVSAGGVGAEIFNARENASTAIIYVLAAFLWIALWWSAGFRKWPWRSGGRGAAALGRLGMVGLLSIIVYVTLYHPHVSYLFYPAQTMAGVEPWWREIAMTSSAYFNLGLMLCFILWVVVSDVLWEGCPWSVVDADGDGNAARGLVTLIGTVGLGVFTFLIMLYAMEVVWMEPFEGGQYTDAPYFRYLHAGEMAGFGILAAFAVRTYFPGLLLGAPLIVRAAVRTVAAAAGAVVLYLFYYSDLATLLLGKVPGVGQPEDTPLVWTLLFASVVMVQAEFFQGWPLPRREQAR